MIPSIPNEVVLMIMENFSLKEWMPLEIVSSAWYESRFDVYRVVSKLGYYRSCPQLIEKAKYLNNIRYYGFADSSEMFDVVNNLPNLDDVACVCDIFDQEHTCVYDLRRSDVIKEFSISEVGPEDIFELQCFTNLEILYIDMHGYSWVCKSILQLLYLKSLRELSLYIYTNNLRDIGTCLDLSGFSLEKLDIMISVFNNITDVYWNDFKLLLPTNLQLLELDIDYSKELCDHIIEVSPKMVKGGFNKCTETQLEEFEIRLDKKNIRHSL